ncbi:hypothetical protein [uncultured Mucilaginibacter sp.]|uniref:hypothetical protein n=1 Tax=uncultured Mucilaginibacter sp. TaxID=797541 RepID=UPI0025EA6F0A|nr:hypothetical protein [uncultured Mucilaginibacter sp.]
MSIIFIDEIIKSRKFGSGYLVCDELDLAFKKVFALTEKKLLDNGKGIFFAF